MIELVADDVAYGGDAVARAGRKVHFVPGVLPGERFTAEVVFNRGPWAKARLVELLEPSTDRVQPRCPHFGDCGGCTWQFASYPAQLRWKRDVVAGQLRHLGGLADPPVADTVAPGEPWRYRNRMDFTVVDGRPGLHRKRTQELVPLSTCLIQRPELEEMFTSLGDLTGAEIVTLRVGTRTEERLVMVEGELPPGWEAWPADAVVVRGEPSRAMRGEPWLHEVVAGIRLRVSAPAFFQGNTEGAEALVRLVDEALGLTGAETLLDGYSGGGLFSATVGRRAAGIVAVELTPEAVEDYRFNLGRLLPGRWKLAVGRFEKVARALEARWERAVVDPPRAGLGRKGVKALLHGRPEVVVYVSCNPASLARDAAYLAEAGYRLEAAWPVDLFPQTYHVETVARFVAG